MQQALTGMFEMHSSRLWVALTLAASIGCGGDNSPADQPDDAAQTTPSDGTDAGDGNELPPEAVGLLDEDEAAALCDDIEAAYERGITPDDEAAFACAAFAFSIWVPPDAESDEDAAELERFKLSFCQAIVDNCIKETEPPAPIRLCLDDPAASVAQCAAPAELLTECAEESNRYRKWMIETLNCETLTETDGDTSGLDPPDVMSCAELSALCPEHVLVRDLQSRRNTPERKPR